MQREEDGKKERESQPHDKKHQGIQKALQRSGEQMQAGKARMVRTKMQVV